jgi:hypothetical protein
MGSGIFQVARKYECCDGGGVIGLKSEGMQLWRPWRGLVFWAGTPEGFGHFVSSNSSKVPAQKGSKGYSLVLDKASPGQFDARLAG